MRESRTYGSVRGAPSNGRPYRDRAFARHDEGGAASRQKSLLPAPGITRSRPTSAPLPKSCTSLAISGQIGLPCFMHEPRAGSGAIYRSHRDADRRQQSTHHRNRPRHPVRRGPMRRYWQPAALAEELAGPAPSSASACSARTLSCSVTPPAAYGLLHRHCAHRGADLAFARYEDGGLRRPFHAAGCTTRPAPVCNSRPNPPTAISTPQGAPAGLSAAQNTPASSGRTRVRVPRPDFPGFDCFTAPDKLIASPSRACGCANRLQALEVGIDPAHASLLHRFFEDEDRIGRRLWPPVPCRDDRRRHPDDPPDARGPQSAPGVRGNAVRPAHHHAAPDQRHASRTCASPT